VTPPGPAKPAIDFAPGRGASPTTRPPPRSSRRKGFDPEVWIAGLDRDLAPRWDADDLERRLRAAVERATWDVWERIACPILVVRGDLGTLTEETAAEMATRNPRAPAVTLPGGHDIHLDAPDEWIAVLRAAADRAA
jgi:pimeloyl-ACP methyl ester carboxylesterase